MKKSKEEIGRWNFNDVKNFAYDYLMDYFVFTTCIPGEELKTYTFKTSKCIEMFDEVKTLLAQNLYKNNNIEEAEDIISRAVVNDFIPPPSIGNTNETIEPIEPQPKLVDLLIQAATTNNVSGGLTASGRYMLNKKSKSTAHITAQMKFKDISRSNGDLKHDLSDNRVNRVNINDSYVIVQDLNTMRIKTSRKRKNLEDPEEKEKPIKSSRGASKKKFIINR